MAVLLLMTSALAVGPRPAAADPDLAELLRDDLGGAVDIVVDQEHDRLYISQETDVLLVTDLRGRTVTRMSELVGAEELEIDQVRGRVYVARPAGAGLSVIDTDTMVVRHFPTPGRCPATLAPVRGVVWFSSRCDHDDPANGTINAVDLQSGEVTTVGAGLDYEEAAMVSSPDRAGFLIIYDRRRNPGYITGHQASVGPDGPVLTRQSRVRSNLVVDVEISPDGSTAVVNESYANVFRLGLPDLGFLGRYEGVHGGLDPNYPNLIAFRHDGALVLGRRWYRPGQLRPTNDLDFGEGYSDRIAGAWDGRYFYALVRHPYPDGDDRPVYALTVAWPRLPSTVDITTSRERVVIGKRLRLDLSLETPLSESPREVVVQAVAPDGSRQVVAQRVVGEDGTSIEVAPRRNTVYVASYDGDSRTSPASDSAAVEVRSKIEVRRVSRVHREEKIDYARSGRTIWYRVRASAFRAPSCVAIGLHVRPVSSWHPYDESPCAVLGRDGVVEVGVRIRRGKRPYLHRLSFWLPATVDNAESRYPSRLFQFCRRTVPCDPPPPVYVGSQVLPGPRVRLVARG